DELTRIELRHEDLLEAFEQALEVAGQRPEVTNVDVRDVEPRGALTADRLLDRAVRRTPADDRELARGVADLDGLLGDVLRDVLDLLRADHRHLVMVVGVVGDVPRAVALLEAADAVLEPRRARLGPVAGERGLVAQERMEPV